MMRAGATVKGRHNLLSGFGSQAGIFAELSSLPFPPVWKKTILSTVWKRIRGVKWQDEKFKTYKVFWVSTFTLCLDHTSIYK